MKHDQCQEAPAALPEGGSVLLLIATGKRETDTVTLTV